MIRRTQPPLFGMFVVVLLTYFGQVQPYIHFHHSHEITSWPFELSLHPMDVEPEHIPVHHHDDHHHTYQQYTERGLPHRQQVITIQFSPQLVAAVIWSLNETSNQVSAIYLYDYERQWRLPDLPSSASLRSPPFFA